MTKTNDPTKDLYDSHRMEQLLWQSKNSTPGERLRFAEEMLEFMYATGKDYHAQRALLEDDYKSRRGM